MSLEENRKVFSVREVSDAISQALAERIPALWVRGEICECNLHQPSGAVYFSVKDSTSQIRAVLFRGISLFQNLGLGIGSEVEIFGTVGIFERQSTYQIRVQRVEPVGQGSLYQQYMAMRVRLQAEGLFDPQRKREIPRFPQIVGVVTSPEGAAIRDFLKTLAMHHSGVHVRIFPTLVQGKGAAENIAQMIQYASYYSLCDVLVVTRGGGSPEDLWCFNEEPVARAIFASKIPVISAVGHERDFSISDEVADLRCATPTAAANRVIEEKSRLLSQVEYARQQLQALLNLHLERTRRLYERLAGSFVFQSPMSLVESRQQHLDQLTMRLTQCLPQLAAQAANRYAQACLRLRSILPQIGQNASHRFRMATSRLPGIASRLVPERQTKLEHLSMMLQTLGPKRVLQRGYSILLRGDGHAVRAANEVQREEKLRAMLSDGELAVRVESVP